MRKLVTGTGPDGRSRLVEEGRLELAASPASPGFLSAIAAETTSAPPASRPAGHGSSADLGVAPGLVRWFIVDYEADLQVPVHHTDTVDFDTVLEGSLVLALDDGEHLLESGDIVIVNGVDHAWRAGPKGCRLSVLSVGTPPPATS
jgi:quercetin dioxygenase-like cupin family protein